jgi:membrane protease subunit HflK
MQQVLGATSKVIVDQKGGQNLLYLPLDRIMQLSTHAQAPLETGRAVPPQPVETVPPPVVPEPAATRREGMRSREREAGR